MLSDRILQGHTCLQRCEVHDQGFTPQFQRKGNRHATTQNQKSIAYLPNARSSPRLPLPYELMA